MQKCSVILKNRTLFQSCLLAKSFFERLVGLMGTKKLSDSESMLIEKCKQVHTFFMSFPIDAIFLNKKNEVVEIQELKPWKISKYYRKASKVLEAPIGSSRRLNIKKGERIDFICLD